MTWFAKLFGLGVTALLLGACSTAICGKNPQFSYEPNKDKQTFANVHALAEGSSELTRKFDLHLVGNYGIVSVYCGIPGVPSSDCKRVDDRAIRLMYFPETGGFTLMQTAPGEPIASMNALRADVHALLTNVVGADGFGERRGFVCRSFLAGANGAAHANWC
jgi:hypothetical protein